MSLRNLIVLFMLPVAFSGCLSTAKMSDLPVSSKAINFARYSNEYHEQKEPFWTSKTSNEYYFEKEIILEEEKLIDIIQYALNEKGYATKKIDRESNYVIGKRGMQANEWSSLTGVYYTSDPDQKKLQIYIKTVITQDATGGWSENRAKKVGLIIEQKINTVN